MTKLVKTEAATIKTGIFRLALPCAKAALAVTVAVSMPKPGMAETPTINYGTWQNLEKKQQFDVVSAFINELNKEISVQNRELVQFCARAKVPPGKLDYVPAVMVFMECMIDLGIAKPK